MIDVCCFGCCGPTRTLSEAFGRNLYASARLGAMDGVDLLYSGAQRIGQSGGMSDVRLGLYRTGERDRLSLLVLHSRVSMTHEVTYLDWLWDVALMRSITQTRVEVNEDQTRTWGGHLAWDRALDTPGWRVGASATLNYKDHPKIPNYSLQNIPRDPGRRGRMRRPSASPGPTRRRPSRSTSCCSRSGARRGKRRTPRTWRRRGGASGSAIDRSRTTSSLRTS